MSTEPLSVNDHSGRYDEENPPIAVTVSPIQPGQQGYQPPVTAIPVNDGSESVRIIGVYTINDLSENVICAVTLARNMSLFWLIFLVGPICGYLGATRFDKSYTTAYAVYWGFRVIFDFLAALYLSWFFLLNFILDVIIIRYVWSYLQALNGLSPQELGLIKEAIGTANES